jgi:hypothetical protein
MANRCVLHKNKLDEFRAWCAENSIEVRDGKGEYQLMQVRVDNQWLVIYSRLYMPEHVTVPNGLTRLVRQFVNKK